MSSPEQVRFLTPATLPASSGYSQVVTVTGGRMIYVAGQVALDTSGALVGAGDFRAQSEQVFANLQAALAAAGAEFRQVIKLNMYVLDRVYLPVLREIRDRYVNTEAPPASTLVVVSGLAREDFLLEVEAVASIPA